MPCITVVSYVQSTAHHVTQQERAASGLLTSNVNAAGFVILPRTQIVPNWDDLETLMSCHAADAGDFSCVTIHVGPTNSIVRNNLGAGAPATNLEIVHDAGTGTGLSNNLFASDPAALFLNATPTLPHALWPRVFAEPRSRHGLCGSPSVL